MKCPYCSSDDTKVIDSRPADDNTSIRRRRQCETCGKRFTTYEKLETMPLMVIKKDNSRESYDRSKIESGVVMVLLGLWLGGFSQSRRGFWLAGPGTVLAVMAVFLLAGYNGTAYYPSVADLQSSLTIRNSSSSLFTLKTMFYVSFAVPFVIAYIAYAWRQMDKGRITEKEIEETSHKY